MGKLFGGVFHDYLDGPWEEARGFLKEELEQLKTRLNFHRVNLSSDKDVEGRVAYENLPEATSAPSLIGAGENGDFSELPLGPGLVVTDGVIGINPSSLPIGIGRKGDDGSRGMPGPRGIDGAAGAAGATGPQGATGFIFAGKPGNDGKFIPGTVGPAGAVGSAGAAGALVLLEQHTASSSASLDFTTAISSTYDTYVLEVLNIVPATNNVHLIFRVSTDGGGTYVATGAYSYANIQMNSLGTAAAPYGAEGDTSIALSISVVNTSSMGVSGRGTFYNPGTTNYKNVVYDFSDIKNGNNFYRTSGAGIYGTTAVNAFRFLFSSGNIASGTIRVYGIAKS